MGWLPIALALAGFLFFVAIVNYSSISAHKEAIMQAFFNVYQTAKARHTLTKNLQGIPQEECSTHFLEQDFNLKQRFKKYAECVFQEKKSIEYSGNYLKVNPSLDEESQKLLKSLQLLNHRQHINIKVFNRKVREYNQLLNSYPTKLIARAMNDKPLPF